jgi:hypothetical protein
VVAFVAAPSLTSGKERKCPVREMVRGKIQETLPQFSISVHRCARKCGILDLLLYDERPLIHNNNRNMLPGSCMGIIAFVYKSSSSNVEDSASPE